MNNSIICIDTDCNAKFSIETAKDIQIEVSELTAVCCPQCEAWMPIGYGDNDEKQNSLCYWD